MNIYSEFSCATWGSVAWTVKQSIKMVEEDVGIPAWKAPQKLRFVKPHEWPQATCLFSNITSELSAYDVVIIRDTACPIQWRHNEHDGVSNHRRLHTCWLIYPVFFLIYPVLIKSFPERVNKVVSFNTCLTHYDAIWCHTTWLTLVQVMACCLTAPIHYLNQCCY